MLASKIEDIEKILSDNTINIITDIKLLNIECNDVTDIELGQRIANKLFKIMTDNKGCISLSANQIGINMKVCCVNVTQPFYFINPKIVRGEGMQVRFENCYSLPNNLERTVRFTKLTVECDNYDEMLYWDVSYLKPSEFANNMHALEVAVIQHEIDHLYGKTILDNIYKPTTIVNTVKYGRNDRVTVQDLSGNRYTIKYKDYETFRRNGFEITEI